MSASLARVVCIDKNVYKLFVFNDHVNLTSASPAPGFSYWYVLACARCFLGRVMDSVVRDSRVADINVRALDLVDRIDRVLSSARRLPRRIRHGEPGTFCAPGIAFRPARRRFTRDSFPLKFVEPRHRVVPQERLHSRLSAVRAEPGAGAGATFACPSCPCSFARPKTTARSST